MTDSVVELVENQEPVCRDQRRCWGTVRRRESQVCSGPLSSSASSKILRSSEPLICTDPRRLKEPCGADMLRSQVDLVGRVVRSVASPAKGRNSDVRW